MEHSKAMNDAARYFTRPNNVYLLTKRLTVDYAYLQKLVNITIDQAYLARTMNRHYIVPFPDQEDLHGAATGLMRLQDTYNLNTRDMADGILNGVNYDTKMTAHDCFEIGRIAYFEEDFYHTELWMQEALRRLSDEEHQSMSNVTVLEYLSFVSFKQGAIALAVELTKQILKLEPSNEEGLHNLEAFQEIMVKRNESEKLRGDDGRGNETTADFFGMVN